MITLITVLTTVVAKNEHLDEQLWVNVKIDSVLGVNLTASNL